MKKINEIIDENKLSAANDEKTIRINPNLAKEMLETMESNRPYKPSLVAKYSHDMKEGRWAFSPYPISFDENGHLIDGQHRLGAIIDSGKTYNFTIAFNVPRKTPIDIHKQRNTSDNLVFSGRLTPEQGNRKNVSIANAALKIRMGGSTYNSLSDYDKEIILKKYWKEINLSESISHAGASAAILRKATVQASFLSAIIFGANVEKMYDFAESANTGLPHGDNPSPALVARRMIEKLKLNRRQMTSVVEQALYDCLIGKTRSRNYDPDGDSFYTDRVPLDLLLEEGDR